MGKMGINAFFENVLGANVKNQRWSWGAVDPRTNRVFLRIWRDEIPKLLEGRIELYDKKRTKRDAGGYNERHAHLRAIMSGAEAYGVVCTAVSTDDSGPREIQSFDDSSLVRIADITEDDDRIYGRIVEQVPSASLISRKTGFSTLSGDIASLTSKKKIEATMKQAMVSARIGQGAFRAEVLASWNGCCAVTGSTLTEAIRASHIRPWRDSTDFQRLDPHNGIALIATLDALFDAGLITFSQTGAILVSTAVPAEEARLLNLDGARLARLPSEKSTEYLSYHREQIFVKDRPLASIA